MSGGLRPWHIIVLVVVLIVLFGAKKLPDAARSLGRSMRIFKAETKSLLDDDVASKSEAKTTYAKPEPRLSDDEASPLDVDRPTDVGRPGSETRDDRR